MGFFVCYFNMIDAASDHKGGAINFVNGREKSAYLQMKQHFHLANTFLHHKGHIQFCWDNAQQDHYLPKAQARQDIAARRLRWVD
jgi:hypothetical protein